MICLPKLLQPVSKMALALILLSGTSFLLSSCATSKLNAVTKVIPQEAYVNLMVLYVDNAPEVTELNKETYNSGIRKKFNSLNNIKVRTHLEKTIARNVGTHATLISPASRYFSVGDDVDYDAFLARVKESGAEGLILVNNNANWSTTTNSTNSVNNQNAIQNTPLDTAPNAAFLCYLIDLKSNKAVWMGQANVLGTTMADYNSISNSLARSVARQLKKEGFITASVEDIKTSKQVSAN